MHITLVDESFPFNGYTPSSQPLGGAEKAFASLPSALSFAGHEVRVFNRTQFPVFIDGAEWEPIEGAMPEPTEALIAFRKPGLLAWMHPDHLTTGKRVLWWNAPARLLDKPATREILAAQRAVVVFQGKLHRGDWQPPEGARAAVVVPGLRDEYREAEPTQLAERPRAIVTTHPLHGLDWLLALWVERIHPVCPDAELVVYSSGLYQALQGKDLGEALRPVFQQAKAAAAQGVTIAQPLADGGMAEAYRSARVHLYPGHEDDMLASTLMESQACGLPAVARPLGAVPERLVNGQTGYLVPDDDAFVNLSRTLLTSEDFFWSLSAEARQTQAARSWADAAQDFEKVLQAT